MIIGSICHAIAEHIRISVTFIPPQKRESCAHTRLSFSCHWAGDVQEIVNDVCVCPSISVLHKLTLVSLPPACINNCQCLLLLHTRGWNCFPQDEHIWVNTKLKQTHNDKVSLCVCAILHPPLTPLSPTFVNAWCSAHGFWADTAIS